MNEFDELIIEYIKDVGGEPPLFLLNLYDLEEATRILKDRNGQKVIWQETDKDMADGGDYAYV
tara:strand:+ start:941 stop:1129 length:189 start_codon:yes stop_codon:yes gene_type:complete